MNSSGVKPRRACALQRHGPAGSARLIGLSPELWSAPPLASLCAPVRASSSAGKFRSASPGCPLSGPGPIDVDFDLIWVALGRRIAGARSGDHGIRCEATSIWSRSTAEPARIASALLRPDSFFFQSSTTARRFLSSSSASAFIPTLSSALRSNR